MAPCVQSRNFFAPSPAVCDRERMEWHHDAPVSFSALQAASDSMNKGFLAPVYNMAAFKVLSIMAAPYYLPFELAIVLGKRCVLCFLNTIYPATSSKLETAYWFNTFRCDPRSCCLINVGLNVAGSGSGHRTCQVTFSGLWGSSACCSHSCWPVFTAADIATPPGTQLSTALD